MPTPSDVSSVQPLLFAELVTPILVLAPHADDESLGCGGLLRAATERELPVEVWLVSDGSMSHPQSVAYDAAARRDLREQEFVQACQILGVPSTALRFFRLPDTQVPRRGDAAYATAVAQFAEQLMRLRPGTVFTPWRRDPHCDHEATTEMLLHVVEQVDWDVRVYEYPIWLYELASAGDFPLPREVDTYVLTLTAAQLEQKRAAIECHRSQMGAVITDDPTGFVLTQAVIDHFSIPQEYYYRTRPAAHNANPTDNTQSATSLEAAYFDAIYADSDDPWGFRSRTYELHKYMDTLQHLPRQHYNSAFEPGCSVGVLSAMLAKRCDRLLSVDVSERAIQLARQHHGDLPNVRFEQSYFPRQRPDQTFDLIVLSEVAYYWGDDEFTTAQEVVLDLLRPGGHLVLVHWTPYVDDYPLTGDEVHDRFLAFAKIRPRLSHRFGKTEATYRLDVFEA